MFQRTKGASSKTQQYVSHLGFNIIILNMSTYFSIAVFYSICLTPYTSLSILVNLRSAVQRFRYHKMSTSL
jgi:hypothetical protein